MTEMGAMAEKPAMFANLKDKLSKTFSRFTVDGAKQHFYEQNAEQIKRATANLSPQDKAKAAADIEAAALGSAKVDVAVHWGSVLVGSTAAATGLALLTPRFQKFAAERGGGLGRTVAEGGKKASAFIDRIVHGTWRRHGEGRVTAAGKNLQNIDAALKQRIANNTASQADLRELTKLKKAAEKAFQADQQGRLQNSINAMADRVKAQQADAKIIENAALKAREAADAALKKFKTEKSNLNWAKNQIK